jgi:preprotein translocase subunit SecG
MADSNRPAVFSTGFIKLPNSTRTMRTRIWIFGAVILAICILLVLFWSRKQEQPAQQELAMALTNQPVQPGLPKTAGNQQRPKATETATILPPVTVSTAYTDDSNTAMARVLRTWHAPIEFYGKVIDENSNAVSGAQVKFHWVETPDESGNKDATTESDAEGLFSLHGARGPDLAVSVGKEGYYSSREKDHPAFKYGSFALGDFSPDPQNPVVFHLRKKGTPEPLLRLDRSYRIARDGTPVSVDLATGASTTGESGNFVVQCWTKDQGKKSGEKYDWRCVITMPGGGIVPVNEEFAFQAPQNGYALTNEIAMPADSTNWTSQVDLKFFYRLADGHYGRMKFSMIAGGQHFCMIESVLNPTGSRNLEPAN